MASITFKPAPAIEAGQTRGPASLTDLFPLTPFFPIGGSAVDRKQRFPTQSGKWFVRSQGDDLGVYQIEGRATSEEIKTLLDFYEDHALIGCTFRDATFNPAVDRRVQFSARPRYSLVAFEFIPWSARLVETVTV